MFVLLRHADAVAKRAWDGRDLDRPLSELGLRQAQELVGSLSEMPLRRLLTSPALRCAQTLEPLAHHLDLAIESTSLLARDSEAPLVAQLAEDPRSEDALLCTHGETLAAVFRHWQRQGHIVSDTARQGDPQEHDAEIGGMVSGGEHTPTGQLLPTASHTRHPDELPDTRVANTEDRAASTALGLVGG